MVAHVWPYVELHITVWHVNLIKLLGALRHVLPRWTLVDQGYRILCLAIRVHKYAVQG